MKLPSLAQAESMLLDAEKLNPGAWVPHVRNVALAAKCIAEKHPKLEPDAAFIMGLVHDIGRREGVSGMRHTLDGYSYLMDKGFDDAARICLTHSFPFQDIEGALGVWDVSDEQYAFLKNYLETVHYDDYDRLLQLCDALGMAEGICLMEKRIVDAVMRHGFKDSTLQKWQAYFELVEYFNDAIGTSIYSVLPNVIETTFGFKA